MRRLYYLACKRFGPRKLTLSAYAWARFKETGNSYWRDRIDGVALFFRSERDHCQGQFQREMRVTQAATKGPRK